MTTIELAPIVDREYVDRKWFYAPNGAYYAVGQPDAALTTLLIEAGVQRVVFTAPCPTDEWPIIERRFLEAGIELAPTWE